MAVELATAYVSLVASAKGIGGSIADSLGAPIEKAASESGDKASKGFGDKFSVGMAAIGVAAGAVLAQGLNQAIDNSAVSDKLSAQLGASGDWAADLGKIAGDLYAGAYGDSLETVNEALKGVMQNGVVFEDATNEEIEATTAKVLDLATAFDQDLGATTNAVGQMIRTGLAADANEALDLITRGMQQGADASGDLLDTFIEYPALFERLGLDGASAMGMIEQGMGAGARNADLVADALKEFQIRATDGSKASSEAFAALGMDAEAMTAQIAAGGEGASAGLDTVLDSLRGMTDPVQRNAAAVGLFGTQAEDLGEALFAIDPSTAVASLGNVEGAAAAMGETLNDNAATSIESLKRGAMQRLTDFMTNTLIPTVEKVVGWFQRTPAAVDAVKVAIAALGAAAATHFTVLGVKALWAGAQAVASSAMQIAAWAGTAIAATANAFAIAAAWLISLGPIALVIAAVVGLAIIIIKNFDTIKAWIAGAWEFVKEKTAAAWEWIKGALGAAFDFMKNLFLNFTGPGLIIKHWDTIKGAFTAAVDFIKEKVDAIIGFFSGIGEKIGGAAKGMWDGIKDSFKGAVNWIIDKWNGLRLVIGGQDVDLPFGQSFSIPKITLDTPDIPRFHGGGIYQAPTPGGEGLAMLRDGERVLTPEQQAMGGVAVNVYGSTDVVALAEQVARTLEWRQLTTAGR